MKEQDDILQRIFFDLQWGNGGDPTPGGGTAAQTGDPLFIFICMIILVAIIAGLLCYAFRDKLFELKKVSDNCASAVSSIPLSSKIAIAIASAVAIVLCSLVFVAGNAYANEDSNGEWNWHRPHIKSNAYLDPSTGDITFDIPAQTQPYAGKALVYGFGVNLFIESSSLSHCWWEVYFDDQCIYSYYGIPLQVGGINAIVGHSFNIKLIARNVNVDEVSPFIGADSIEFFYAMVDSKYYATMDPGTSNCAVPVNITGLEITDQDAFKEFCTENKWEIIDPDQPSTYYKMYSSDILTANMSVVIDPWVNLVSKGILKSTDSKQFSHFHPFNTICGYAPVNTMIQSLDECIDDIWYISEFIPCFSSNEMYPVVIEPSDLIDWTEEGRNAAKAAGWTENARGKMTKSFPGETTMLDVMNSLPDRWFNLENVPTIEWCWRSGTVYDLYFYHEATAISTTPFWRYERIDGTLVDENGQPMKDVRIFSDINAYNPDLAKQLGFYVPDTDISDSNGNFVLYFPKTSIPLVYCDDGDVDGLVPNIMSDTILLDEYKPYHFDQFTVYKCAQFNVTEQDVPQGADTIYFEYVTKDKYGKELIFYSDQSLGSSTGTIRVPANSKGYIITEDPTYTFAEAKDLVTAPDWGKTTDVNRTVILRQANEEKDPGIPDEPIVPDPVVPDPVVPDPSIPVQSKK